jgi:hypothetical protein
VSDEELCIDCGRPRDEHHEFVAPKRPQGCVCAALTWGNPGAVPPVCGRFDSMTGADAGYCKNCEHDEACHAKAEAVGPTSVIGSVASTKERT